MYVAAEANECLVQGDICRDIVLPLLSTSTKLVDVRAQQLIEHSVPTEEMMSTRSQLAALIPMVRSHVIVLSQSCDLADAESKPNARVIVAPTMHDDDDRFAAAYAAAVKGSSDALAKKLAAAAKSATSANVDTAIARGKDALENPRRKALEDLWLGKLEGVFPLAACPEHGLRRSLCYFDNVVSLPSSWIHLLKSHRVLRLNAEWADVLREKLSLWIGRYAFPGDKSARLAHGGLADEPSSASPGDS